MEFTSFSNIINGKPQRAHETHHGINPSTEEPLWEVPCATEADLEDAVEAAQRVSASWSQTAFGERCGLVRQYAEAFIAYEKEFVELLMKETGKPVSVTGLVDNVS